MQPRPIADTSSPCEPSLRVPSTGVLLDALRRASPGSGVSQTFVERSDDRIQKVRHHGAIPEHDLRGEGHSGQEADLAGEAVERVVLERDARAVERLASRVGWWRFAACTDEGVFADRAHASLEHAVL